jgi:hypothetical protein
MVASHSIGRVRAVNLDNADQTRGVRISGSTPLTRQLHDLSNAASTAQEEELTDPSVIASRYRFSSELVSTFRWP